MTDKLKLPNVTLIAISGDKPAQTIAAMFKCMAQCEFGAVRLITNIDISVTGIDVVRVDGLRSWEDYNRFCVKDLNYYFETKHCLLVQWDGYVLDASQWDDSFVDYDYIGAKWLDIGKPYNVGNGGFSLRSKKLQQILAVDELINITCPEDTSITKVYGQYLKDKYQIKFASEEIADKFSFELNAPYAPTFGFHGFHQKPFKETIIVKRSYALGDVIMAEPVLHYFHKKGYNVAINTTLDFAAVYANHYFPVKNKKDLDEKLKYTEIDLDLAYEINPTRSVLESYFEIAGIENEPLRNSRLNINAWAEQKIFKKYCIIHLDDTGMPYRNQYGINWKKVVLFLEERGYLVFQIGKRVEKEVAPFLNTYNLQSTMFMIKGADLFIGLDSGCAQIAVGLNIPSVIFFGSVNPNLRYVNFDRIRVVQSECPKDETKNCYHKKVGYTGVECVYDKDMPPCATYSSDQVINAIKSFNL